MILRRLLVGVAALLLVVAAWAVLRSGGKRTEVRATLTLLETLGGADTAGYARADRVRELVFPDDHGPHPDFRTEWWYLTGNLESDEGRRFGYQLTFFRSALAPPPGLRTGARPPSESPSPEPSPSERPPPEPPRSERAPEGADGSRWATRQAWMAHFTLTDPEGRQFHAFERFERGALGLAGAELDPFRVWVGPWELQSAAPTDPRSIFPLTLRADADSVVLHLTLEPRKGIVLQGNRGLSRKGPGPGQASYYYSMPRLGSEGRVVTPDGTRQVQGTSWLDREWSTSVLPQGVVGWDWFALQLDDGRDVMVYRLRREDGTPSPFSRGVVVGPDGQVRHLDPQAFDLDVLDRWESPLDGASYPSRWRLRLPTEGLDLEVRPVLADQELRLAFRYWEGAVDVRRHPDAPAPGANSGAPGTGPSRGHGYVELTGYAEAGQAPRGGS